MAVQSNDPETALLIGLDIGGTKSAAVVGDGSGRIFARMAGPTPRDSWREALEFFLTLIESACREHGVDPKSCAAAGVSFGGPWDSRREVTRTPPNLPGWGEIPLRRLLTERLGIDVAVENDANATALAEHRWGAGQGCRDMAFLTIGTGIGAGLILDGRLYRGRSDFAGEVGHTVLLPDGPLCGCGKRGCLEALASGTAIGRIGTERYREPVDAVEVCRRARLGDAVALGIVDEAAQWMGLGIANLLQTLNLERVVLGTLAVSAGDLFLEPIRRAAQRYCWPEVWDSVEIVAAGPGDRSQDMAALAVAAGVLQESSIH
jgi:glucokinase